MRYLLIILIAAISFPALAQDMSGDWVGVIQKKDGYKYTFRLRILPHQELLADLESFNLSRKENIGAIVTHDRNGEREVFRLSGNKYYDNSIYLHEHAGERKRNREKGLPFSRLQFVLKSDQRGPYLEGHWQEYLTIRKYRKGRLLLRRIEFGT